MRGSLIRFALLQSFSHGFPRCESCSRFTERYSLEHSLADDLGLHGLQPLLNCIGLARREELQLKPSLLVLALSAFQSSLE